MMPQDLLAPQKPRDLLAEQSQPRDLFAEPRQPKDLLAGASQPEAPVSPAPQPVTVGGAVAAVGGGTPHPVTDSPAWPADIPAAGPMPGGDGSDPVRHGFVRGLSSVGAMVTDRQLPTREGIVDDPNAVWPTDAMAAGPTAFQEPGAVERRQTLREAGIQDFTGPAPTTPAGQAISGLIQGTVESIPAMAAAAPLQIPGRAGQLVGAGLSRIPGGQIIAPAASGVASMAAGAAEFGAAAKVPEAIRTNDVQPVLEGAAHPFTAAASITAKAATGRWDEITVDEMVNAGFLVLGGVLGQLRGKAPKGQESPAVQAKTTLSPEGEAWVRNLPEDQLQGWLDRLSKSDNPGKQAMASAIRERMGQAPATAPAQPTPAKGPLPESRQIAPEGQPNVPRETSVPAQPRDVLAEQPPAPVTESPVATVKPPATDVSSVPVAPRSVQETQPDAQAQPTQPPVETPEPTAAQVETPRAEQPQAAKPVAQDAETGQGGPAAKDAEVEAFSIGDDGLFSARAAHLDKIRAELGLDEMPGPARTSFANDLAEAKRRKMDEEAQPLARTVIANPRALDRVESAGMVLRGRQLRNKHAEIRERMKNNPDAATPEDGFLLAELERDLGEITLALRKSGTERGRQLASQKLTIDRNYDLASMVAEATANKGGAIDRKVRAELDKLSTEIEKLRKANESLEADVKQLRIENAVEGRHRNRKPRAESRQVLEKNKAKLRDMIKKGCVNG